MAGLSPFVVSIWFGSTHIHTTTTTTNSSTLIRTSRIPTTGITYLGLT